MSHQKNDKFDSVILAGGFGKRLSPITDTIPKPMLPIDGISAFERNLSLLKKCGFKKTAVTTMYLPEKIERLGDFSGSVEYFREEKPLGSAGAVAKLKGRTDDCLLVISGDAICDFDLKKAKEEFLKSGCDAAMVLCRTKDSGEYGSVCVQKGRVTGFCEKPSVRDTLSDLINTGIYFIGPKALSMIPDDTLYDFGRDLFPNLLRAGVKIAGIEPLGHWFDIGSFGEYHRCNMWMSNADNCIGNHASLHPGARIEYCVIMNNCSVGNSVLRGSIICEGAVIGNDCIIPTGCVIGPGAELRDGTSLAPGSIIGTGLTCIGDSFVDTFPKPKQCLTLDDDAIIADEIDEGYFVRLGKLLGESGNIIAFAEGNAMTLPKACELACGVSEAGNACTVVSGGNASLASFTASEYDSKTAYIAKNGDKTEIRLFSRSGMPYSREELRKLSGKNAQTASKAGSVYLLPHGALVKRYLQYLRDNAVLPTKINIEKSSENVFLRECVEELGIKKDENGATYSLTDDGEKAFAILPDGREISYWQLVAICCIEGKRNGIILPNDTPTSVERILRRHSVDVAFYGDSESDVRLLASGDRLHRDGVLLALTAAGLAEKSGVTLGELADKLPPFTVITRLIFTERDKMSSVISTLREECGNARCAGFDFGDGRVNVYASASGRFRLVAEATDSETAEEITLRAIDMLEKK